jgi:hypothetical protein
LVTGFPLPSIIKFPSPSALIDSVNIPPTSIISEASIVKLPAFPSSKLIVCISAPSSIFRLPTLINKSPTFPSLKVRAVTLVSSPLILDLLHK